MRDFDHVVGQSADCVVAFADDGDHRAAAGLDLFQVRHHLVVDEALRHEEHAGRVFVDQGDRAVLHLGGRDSPRRGCS